MHINIFHADPLKSGKGKKYIKLHFRAWNLFDAWVSGILFSCYEARKVLTSALITQVYRQNLSHKRV